MDECSQIVESSALAPLMVADKFVLVGDDKQLPPVVKSELATFVLGVGGVVGGSMGFW